jgi:hypothetical protein
MTSSTTSVQVAFAGALDHHGCGNCSSGDLEWTFKGGMKAAPAMCVLPGAELDDDLRIVAWHCSLIEVGV